MALTAQGMAEEMERQLRCLWAERWGHELTDIGSEQRRLLFLAVARGIFKYLKDQEDLPAAEHLFSSVTVRRGIGGFSWPETMEVRDLAWNLEIPPCGDE